MALGRTELLAHKESKLRTGQYDFFDSTIWITSLTEQGLAEHEQQRFDDKMQLDPTRATDIRVDLILRTVSDESGNLQFREADRNTLRGLDSYYIATLYELCSNHVEGRPTIEDHEGNSERMSGNSLFED